MRSQALDVASELRDGSAHASSEEVEEAAAFLDWLEDHNFTFLGYRDSEGSGLGILRDSDDDDPAGGLAQESGLLTLTKANARSTVHRPSYLDYVGVAGHSFVGLYTHTAYRASPADIPMLRRKVAAVLEQASFPPGSHNEKALLEILDTYPRDELFQISGEELFEVAMGILHLGERQRLRLFARRDPFGRFFSMLVFVPRDRFNTENRRRIEAILRNATSAASIDYTTRVSESVLVRLHFTAYVEPGMMPEFDDREIEMMLVAATRSWADDLQEALADEIGEERGGELFRRYGEAFPAAYRADWVARSALADIVHIEELPQHDGLGISLYRPLEAGPRMLRAKLFRAGRALTLSDVLPLFENMGVEVADERPYPIVPRGADGVWIYDFGLTYSGEGNLDANGVRDSFQEAFVRAWRGEVENDGYNRLVLGGALTWREITVLRAIGKYLRQARITYSDSYVGQALVANPEIARLMVALFQARFDPRRTDREDAEEVASRIDEAIDAVESLDQDQILRMFLDVIRAMLRTNYFHTGPSEHAQHLSFKLDPSELRWLPQPRPRYEIFVYSPRTEGVHLRGGSVARGGIRWSDRREDFRTEVLGLMKAQMVKNAVIVPMGAKGGFVVKQPPARRDDLPEEVVACYQTFIRGLLDLTDDIEGGEVVAHPGIVRYDGDDPYLVVAADKGTATFSDIANGIAIEEGFWLGDAFASGGSTGYDHKKMGITARGAWESVKRHFRELGRDIQSQDLTVVGSRGHGGGRVRQRDAAVAPHPPCGRLQPPARVHRPEPRRRAQLRGAPAAVRAARIVLGRLRPGCDLGGRRRVRAHGEVDPAVGRGARGARHQGRVAQAERADPGAAARAGRPALERRDRHVREGQLGVARRRGRQGQRRRPRERLGAACPGDRRGRQPRRHAGRARGVRARGRAREHRRDRQLGRGRLLGPRGEHQDPAERRRRGRRPDREAAQLAPGGDDGRRGGARPEGQLRAGRDTEPRRGERLEHVRRARALPALPRDAPQPGSRARGASERRGVR